MGVVRAIKTALCELIPSLNPNRLVGINKNSKTGRLLLLTQLRRSSLIYEILHFDKLR